MMRKYLTILLAGFSGWALMGHAAQTTSATTPPPISDQEVARYLKGSDLTAWQDATKMVTDGNAKIAQGQKDQTATQDPNAITKIDISALKAKGNQEVKDGRALLKTGADKQSALRTIAIANKAASIEAIKITNSANLEVATGQFPDVIHGLCEKLLTAVWDKAYKRIYLADVYSFAEPNYEAKPDLTEQVRQQLLQVDKDKKTLVLHDWSFKIGQENGRQVIAFPDRASALQGGGRAVAIVGEVLNETHTGYATLSLRAVDLGNMRIVASQVALLSVEPTLGKLLGMPAFRVLAKRDVPAAGDKAAARPVAITVNLQDPSDIFSSSKKTAYSFRVGTAGHADTLENRFALLLLKSYLFDRQSGINLSDQDFVSMVFAPEKPGDAAAAAPDVGGIWTLPNLAEISDNIDLSPLKQKVYSSNVEKSVGKATIMRDLPKLSPPTPEDLRAAGYK